MFDHNAYEVRIAEHHQRVSDVDRNAWKHATEHGKPRVTLTEHFLTAARRASIPAAAVLSGSVARTVAMIHQRAAPRPGRPNHHVAQPAPAPAAPARAAYAPAVATGGTLVSRVAIPTRDQRPDDAAVAPCRH
jgi:hypothetical protein